MRPVFRLAIISGACLLASCAHVPRPTVNPMLGENTWRSFDGKEMPWRGRDVPHGVKTRAVVITVHGLSGAASDFWPLEEAWPKEGVAVCGLELRGQGNDPDVKHRGDIRRAKVWQEDLRTFDRLVREKHPGVPVFWYAESLGALIALHTAAGEGAAAQPAGIIFSSPAAGLKMKPDFLKNILIRTAMALSPGYKVNLEKLAGVKDEDIRVTNNTTHEAQMVQTPHYVPEFTLRLLSEVHGMMKRNPSALKNLKQPLLVLASPNDVIASPKQIQQFFDIAAPSDKTIRWYMRSYHLLLHDVQREEVLHDATQWLRTHVDAAHDGKNLAASRAHP